MTDHVDSPAVPIGPAGVFGWRPVRAQMPSARTEDIWFLDPDTDSPAPSIEPPAEASGGGACHLSFMDDLGVVDTSTSARIAFSVSPGTRRLTIRIWDDFGEPVQTLVDEMDPSAGRRVVTWDGSDATGASRSPGDFLLRLTIDDLSDSRRLHFRPVTLDPAKEPEYFHKPVAKQVHGGRAVAGTPLSELFDDPPRLMQALVEAGYVDVEHPRHSRFLELLAFENGPMYKVFTPAERDIIMDWMESLRASPGEGADPVEEDSSEDLPSRMAHVIAKYAPQARMAHSGIHLTGPDGHGVPLVDLFDRPRALVQALSTNGWVVPGAADRSLFVTRVASNGGPMDGVIDPPDLEIVRRWIDAGAHLPAAGADHTAASVARYRWPTAGASSRRQRIGMGTVH